MTRPAPSPTLPCPPAGRRRLPPWLRVRLPTVRAFAETEAVLRDQAVRTVCESARCPNQWECWSRHTATFMIAGDRCTRACRFCAVTTGKPLPLDAQEPLRVAEAARRMGLRHVVLTAVARDDLPDGGAEHFRQTILAVRRRNPGATVEVLVPDFNGDAASIATVLDARPEVFNHNLETVRRLTPAVRSRATYDRSLEVLRRAHPRSSEAWRTKSGLMLGLGETDQEVAEALRDLRAAGCDLLTLGQYLQPTVRQLPVAEFIHPDRFAGWAQRARALGFDHVVSGPLVRSSYHADDLVRDLPAGQSRRGPGGGT
ncbi:MAG: lipoyl synthase [Verrucomicrobia bacterium]|nr:lipoyl synthase [Verrucomicrobiota bacterium]